MPVPSNRVPVRVARGTYANLNAAVASLAEGEICYATDQNRVYVVEGGILTAAGDLGAASVNDLGDVDTTGVATNDVLAYDGANFSVSQRLANVVEDTTPQLGGDLDLNANAIVSVSNNNIRIAPDGNGLVQIEGNATGGSGKLGLACELNTHHVYLEGPPHSAAATYTLTLPLVAGASGEALSKGTGNQLEWVEYIPLATLKAETAAATDFADFQARIALL